MDIRHSGEGTARVVLIIDLSTGDTECRTLSEDMARRYLGGHGIGSWLLHEFIPKGADPLGEDNALVFGAGTLVGTPFPTASRSVFMARSPLSGFLGLSNAGHLGFKLRKAGISNLVLRGKAAHPVYVKITDSSVELCRADHLWGKDTFDTADILWAELGSREYDIAAIGPAGENLVRYACVIGNKYAAYGRAGLGAVMGSKNLKAIAVYGSGEVPVANLGHFLRETKEATRAIMSDEEGIRVWRSGGTWGWITDQIKKGGSRMFSAPQNPNSEVFQDGKLEHRFEKRVVSCPGCPIGCKAHLKLKDGRGKYPGMDFALGCTGGTMNLTFGSAMGVQAYDDIARCAELSQRYGVDTMSAAGMIAWTIELFEHGILTETDMDGITPAWGDHEFIFKMLSNIVSRRGLGDILAQGPVRAAELVGNGSDAFLIHWKGLGRPKTMLTSDIRANDTLQAMSWAVNPRGGHIDRYRFPGMLEAKGGLDPELATQYARHIGVNELMMDSVLNNGKHEIGPISRYVESYNTIINCLGICDRPVILESMPVDRLARVYEAATGIEMTAEEMTLAGERIFTTEKLFNKKHGHTRTDDAVPDRFFRESVRTADGDEHPPLTHEKWESMLTSYYESHGWDRATGWPTHETLDRLGLQKLDASCV